LKSLKVIIYKTIILPVVLCGCETWSLTLREEHRLRVFENRVLSRIFGPKKEEVTGECKKVSGACSMNGGEEERVLVIGGKAREKETARKLGG
jgi:hypothetical protein